MQKSVRLFAFATMTAVALTACSGDGGGGGGTNSGDPLTAAEANEVFAALFDIGFGAALAPGGPMASSGPAAVAFSESISQSETCPGGGSIGLSGTVSGDIDESTFDGTINMDVTETLNSCVVTLDASAVTVTVNGDPNIKITADITIANSGASFSGTFGMNGGFTYTGDDGRSGGCAVNVSVNLTNQSASGSVCGQSISGV
jgi:hypothetical protein